MSKDNKKISDNMKVDIGKFTALEYNSIAKSAQLKEITLLSSQFDFSPMSDSSEENWRLGYGVKVNSCKYDLEKGWVAAVIKYSMIAKSGRRRVVNCQAEYGVFYNVGIVENSDAAEGFCNNVGTFAAYPYFRALVANLIWNAGLNLPPMPAISSTAHIPKEKESSSE